MNQLPDKKTYRQRFSDIKIETGMSLLTDMRSKWRYDMNLVYRNFSDLYGSMEQNAGLRMRVDRDIKWPLFVKDPSLFIHANADLFMNKYDTSSLYNSVLVKITPGISGSLGPMKLKLGIKAIIDSDSITDMKFYPMIDLNLHLIPDILVLNAMVTGDAKRSSYQILAEENPFVSPQLLTNFTTEKVHFTAGLRTGFGRNLNINVAFSTSEYSDYPLFMADTTAPLFNQFVIAYDNIRVVSIKADALYQYAQKLRFALHGSFYNYSPDKEAEAWYKPQFESRLSAMYNLYNSIVLTGEFCVNGERIAPLYKRDFNNNKWELSSITLKPYYDLNLGVEYRYNKVLSGFLMVNNLTAKKYQQWYNFPSHGFNVMLGVTYAL